MYCVTAMRAGRQVPAFYLDENTQGIRNEVHATAIAREVLGLDRDDESLCVVYLGCSPGARTS